MTVQVGQVLGAYRLKRRLGSGAFADVFLGEHIHLHTEAAIKVLRASLVDQEESFLQEARTIARLEHEHIVRVLDFAIDKQGPESIPYLVMDYASKGNILQRHPRGARSQPNSEQIALYIEQIASALDHAHAQKQPVVHRDVKPENILINKDGKLLLSDFGIAVILEQQSDDNSQQIAGTKTYIAPEQIEGHPLPQSDQYALAIIVYEWLCGEPPFPTRGRTTLDILSDHLYREPPSLRSRGLNIPSRTDEVIMRALAKDPKRRYAAIGEFAHDLKRSFNEKPGPITLPPPAPGLASPSNAPTEQSIPGKNIPVQQPGARQAQQNLVNRGILPPPDLHARVPGQSGEIKKLSRDGSISSPSLEWRYLFAHKLVGFRVLALLLILISALLVNIAFPGTYLWIVSLLVAIPLFGFCILVRKGGLNLLLALLFACYWALIGLMVDVDIFRLDRFALFSLLISFGASLGLLMWYVLTK